MWLVGGSTRLAYTCIYKDDANAVFWLAIIYLAFHPIGDFQRCFLCQVKMTGHWPIGGRSGGGGGIPQIWQGGPAHPILVQKITQATLPVASVTSERTFCALRRLKNYLRSNHETEQLPPDALSQIDYGHTRHCEDCKEVCVCQRTTQRAFKKIWTGVCARLSERWAPPTPHPTSRFKNAPPPLWPSSF